MAPRPNSVLHRRRREREFKLKLVAYLRRRAGPGARRACHPPPSWPACAARALPENPVEFAEDFERLDDLRRPGRPAAARRRRRRRAARRSPPTSLLRCLASRASPPTTATSVRCRAPVSASNRPVYGAHVLARQAPASMLWRAALAQHERRSPARQRPRAVYRFVNGGLARASSRRAASRSSTSKAAGRPGRPYDALATAALFSLRVLRRGPLWTHHYVFRRRARR